MRYSDREMRPGPQPRGDSPPPTALHHAGSVTPGDGWPFRRADRETIQAAFDRETSPIVPGERLQTLTKPWSTLAIECEGDTIRIAAFGAITLDATTARAIGVMLVRAADEIIDGIIDGVREVANGG